MTYRGVNAGLFPIILPQSKLDILSQMKVERKINHVRLWILTTHSDGSLFHVDKGDGSPDMTHPYRNGQVNDPQVIGFWERNLEALNDWLPKLASIGLRATIDLHWYFGFATRDAFTIVKYLAFNRAEWQYYKTIDEHANLLGYDLFNEPYIAHYGEKNYLEYVESILPVLNTRRRVYVESHLDSITSITRFKTPPRSIKYFSGHYYDYPNLESLNYAPYITKKLKGVRDWQLVNKKSIYVGEYAMRPGKGTAKQRAAFKMACEHVFDLWKWDYASWGDHELDGS